ncbi:MAG: hypothetical protein C0501_31525 [Isosphaera sp.]|nr:hypothetical protein [Isosphaera sp.]
MSAPPAIDFTIIRFPTDRLTVAGLRRVYPHSFDLPAPAGPTRRDYYRKSIEDTLGGIVDAERVIASLAFKRVLGLPLTVEESRQTGEDHLNDLICCYMELGLAAGEHHGEQLAREIETQATVQAARYLSHPR